MKKCNFCSEEIQDKAKKCRHCWEWLNEIDLKESLKDNVKPSINWTH